MQDEQTTAAFELKVIERAARDWGCEGDVAEFINLLALRVQALEREVARFDQQLLPLIEAWPTFTSQQKTFVLSNFHFLTRGTDS